MAALIKLLEISDFKFVIAIFFVFAIFMSLILLICFSGIALKIGDKEINIGGIFRIMRKREEDRELRESLKNKTDEIDKECLAYIRDEIEGIADSITMHLLAEHCPFSLAKLGSIVKRELYSRVNHNNLKEKLATENIGDYINRILKKVEEQYGILRYQAARAQCHEQYEEWKEIKGPIEQEIKAFMAKEREYVVKYIKQKIQLYNETRPLFKTKRETQNSCDRQLAKNKAYLERLNGKGEL
jgi:hypothetical protein